MIQGEMCLTIMKITPQCKTILNASSKHFFSPFNPQCVCNDLCYVWIVAEVCFISWTEFPLVSLCERSWDRGWASLWWPSVCPWLSSPWWASCRWPCGRKGNTAATWRSSATIPRSALPSFPSSCRTVTQYSSRLFNLSSLVLLIVSLLYCTWSASIRFTSGICSLLIS